MDMEISFEGLHLSEHCLDECTLSYSVFSYDSDSLSFYHIHTSNIEEGFMSSDKCIFYFYERFWSVFVIREYEVDSNSTF